MSDESVTVPAGWLIKDFADGWAYEDDPLSVEIFRQQGHAIRALYDKAALAAERAAENERAAKLMEEWPTLDIWRSEAASAIRSSLKGENASG